MSQFACPACRRVLKSKPELAGKQVKCTCGQQFRVPAGNFSSGSAGSGSAAIGGAAAANGKVTLSCSCGKRLAAPLSARGKSVRCPCGQVNKVPLADVSAAPVAYAAPVATASQAAANDWLDDLPSNPAAAYPSAAGMALQAQPNPYANPAAGHSGSYASPTPANATANSHLADAQRQLAKDRHNGNNVDRGGSSFFSSSTMGGLFMMVAALIWFFGGLAAGVIFFYPPILFVLGFVALVKGAMGDD
ncbi:membrane protein [Rhodopirellula maiorica SM1]|uniref:Membrane protein n=1 Tax=Rhodopirellula maiorica SM1 TaxID=1265738 RepID=M5S4S3_9BACT|nr:hypothetical protein [Rhodopirellula maiorica]EMI22642.1 membrane protein [Rhodopirellula maiorica SM1]